MLVVICVLVTTAQIELVHAEDVDLDTDASRRVRHYRPQRRRGGYFRRWLFGG